MSALLAACLISCHLFAAPENAVLENDVFRVVVDGTTGAITSLVAKTAGGEMIGEPRLAANFRINLPLPGYQCHYIDGMKQSAAAVTKDGDTVTATFKNMQSERGTFLLSLSYTIKLDGDTLRFHAALTNPTDVPVAEFWFPRLGGWTQFGDGRDALAAVPGYTGCGHNAPLFRGFPGGRGLGAETAEFATSYPGMVMPWWDLYDTNTDKGLYLGYEDETFRLSTWHSYLYPNASGGPIAWMTPEEAQGAPVGLVFSHVRYPYIRNGETLDSGDFVIRLHRGDWHTGSLGYGAWFRKHFPIDKSQSWLRKQSSWFTSILYQPEDKVIADYKTYDQWTQDAQARGIGCYELIGWDKGGIERDYPDYTPEPKLGGVGGFKALMQSIDARGGKCLVFGNYNVVDSCTDWYRDELKPYTYQDSFGNAPNWMAWGESTLSARQGLTVRRHLLMSVIPPVQKILEDKFTQLVRDGAHGLQLDKVCAGSALDFNPLNTLKPDTALCQGLVDGMAQIVKKCRAIRPDFCMASEASQDRLIPYVDVYYRAAAGFDIAPLRYVFPEWTACQHVSAPYDFNGVNGAVLTGAVICVEPDSYQNSLAAPQYQKLGEYIAEINRLRAELADTIFLGNYLDNTGAVVHAAAPDPAKPGAFINGPAGAVQWRVHENKTDGRRALVVANPGGAETSYFWDFHTGRTREADLYEPFQPMRTVNNDTALTIKGTGLHILVEKPAAPDPKVALLAKLGAGQREVVFAREGFDAQVDHGFSCAWVHRWLPPVYHCRADENAIQITIHTPKNAAGTLRLYCIDVDGMGGGRKQEVFVNGTSSATMENFAKGRWVEIPIASAADPEGQVDLRIENRVPGANAVVSLLEWKE